MKDNSLIKRARDLRIKSTDAERLMWQHLRKKQLLNLKFRRQQPIGNYIVDFVCFEKKLVIEIDGGQHSKNENDKIRDTYLKSKGYRVMRFWNNELLANIEGVIERLMYTLPLIPSRQGRGSKRKNL